MEYISSDTNIWLDFAIIDRLDFELLNPPDIGNRLVKMGLQETELTEDEFMLAEELTSKYAKPSLYDCIALAIAKARGITLLTGDGPLRKAAKAEGVRVMGTIGILDQLLDGRYIDLEEFKHCINEMLKHNGKKIRLPERELRKRLEKESC